MRTKRPSNNKDTRTYSVHLGVERVQAMRDHPNVNWSSVCRMAIDRALADPEKYSGPATQLELKELLQRVALLEMTVENLTFHHEAMRTNGQVKDDAV